MNKDCLSWDVEEGTKCSAECPLFSIDRDTPAGRAKIVLLSISGQINSKCVVDKIPFSNQGPETTDGTEPEMNGWVDDYKR